MLSDKVTLESDSAYVCWMHLVWFSLGTQQSLNNKADICFSGASEILAAALC